MATDPNKAADYFDTPARAERLQLLLYLVRNAGEVLYLRAPEGAGKTRFADQLLDILGDEMAVVWVSAGHDSDVAAAAVDQLGLSANDVSPWPDAVMTGLTGQQLLVIVDDADQLGLEAVERLAMLHARGGRLLLVGQGGLAQTSGNWDVQFVDLPAFDAVQTTAFLRTQAAEHAARVTDDLAAGLYRAAKGLPGPLLDALNGVLGAGGGRIRGGAREVDEGERRALWPWAFGGLVVILLSSVILFQDQVNALFEPPVRSESQPQTADVESPRSPQVAEQESPAGPMAVETLRTEAVSALMPEIDLPQLGREETTAALDAMPGAEEPTPPQPATTAVAPQAVSSAEVAAPPGRDETDPLDAVMQDALAAAEAGRQAPGNSEETVPQATPEPAEDAAADEAASVERQADLTTPMQVAAPTADAAQEKIPQPPAVGVEPSPAATAASTPAPKPLTDAAPAPDAKDVLAAAAVEQAAKNPPAQEATKQPADEEPRAGPAPVESRPPPAARPPVVVARTSAAAPSPSVAKGGIRWLQSRAPGHYTLQLVGSRDRAAVQKFVRKHGIKQPYAIFERDLKGEPWYSLVAGDYPDRDAAIAGRTRLPRTLGRSGIWPRTFDSIIKSM